MTEKKVKLLSVDVLYLLMTCMLFFGYIESKALIDLLFLTVCTVYYFRIKIYNWKKYH